MAENEAIFRSVNEAIARTLSEPVPADRCEFTCECAQPECTRQVSMTLAEYRAVRSDPTRFFVYPGHVFHEIEKVVQETAGYEVVEKTESPAREIAREAAS